MREERTNRKTTSIARKIHVGYWFRRFFALLGLDIVILGMLFVAVLVWRLDMTDVDWMSGAKPVSVGQLKSGCVERYSEPFLTRRQALSIL